MNEIKTSLILNLTLQNFFQSFESFILISSDILLVYGNLK